MKTNSPNPVDGDVQALIADCQADIEDLKRSIDRCDAIGTSDYLYQLQSKLKRQYAALASLTAERCGSLIQAVNPKTGSVNIFYRSRGIESIDPEDVAEWEMQEVEHLYTAPPAQLLRPVELPEPYDDGHGNLWLPQDAVIYAVKNAGGEVKS